MEKTPFDESVKMMFENAGRKRPGPKHPSGPGPHAQPDRTWVPSHVAVIMTQIRSSRNLFFRANFRLKGAHGPFASKPAPFTPCRRLDGAKKSAIAQNVQSRAFKRHTRQSSFLSPFFPVK
jgi:hypothetical protein